MSLMICIIMICIILLTLMVGVIFAYLFKCYLDSVALIKEQQDSFAKDFEENHIEDKYIVPKW